jgi:DNA polymerase-3 subunit delta'
MYPLPVETVETLLRDRKGLSPEEAGVLARESDGRPGWALRAIEQPDVLEDRKEQMKLIQRAPAASRDERLRIAATLAKDTETAARALDHWALFWRQVVLAANGAERLMPDDTAAGRLGRAIGAERALRFMDAILRARMSLDQNANPRLTLEVLMLDLPSPARTVPPRS